MSQNGITSTGPRTEAGKAISSRNALSHGLTSSSLVLPWENKADFDGMLNALVAEHEAATITEQIMVREMAENYWRLMRARNQEHKLLSKAPSPNADPSAYLDWEKCVVLSQRYATRFERGFHKCLSTLRTLQKERRAKEAEAQAEVEAAAAKSKIVVQSTSQPPDSSFRKIPHCPMAHPSTSLHRNRSAPLHPTPTQHN